MLADMLSDLEDLASETSWMDRGLCAQADPEAWFPPEQAGPKWFEDAVRICRQCPIQQRCLAYALDNSIPYGIWGGLTEQERRRLAVDVAA